MSDKQEVDRWRINQLLKCIVHFYSTFELIGTHSIALKTFGFEARVFTPICKLKETTRPATIFWIRNEVVMGSSSTTMMDVVATVFRATVQLGCPWLKAKTFCLLTTDQQEVSSTSHVDFQNQVFGWWIAKTMTNARLICIEVMMCRRTNGVKD